MSKTPGVREIEAAYRQAAMGRERPDLMFIQCPECRRSFLLTLRGANDICEHLEGLIQKRAGSKESLVAAAEAKTL